MYNGCLYIIHIDLKYLHYLFTGCLCILTSWAFKLPIAKLIKLFYLFYLFFCLFFSFSFILLFCFFFFFLVPKPRRALIPSPRARGVALVSPFSFSFMLSELGGPPKDVRSARYHLGYPLSFRPWGTLTVKIQWIPDFLVPSILATQAHRGKRSIMDLKW